MKKLTLTMAFAIAAFAVSAQGVLGTNSSASKDFDFQTDGTFRARWLANGPLIFGNTSDPDPNTYAHKNVYNSQYDLVMYNESDIFLSSNCKIYAGGISAYRNTSGYSYFRLFHPSDGSVVLNSYSQEIFLQPDGGVVYVGEPYYHSLPTNLNKLSVSGSAHANGYAAGIVKKTATYTATNDDYTILGDASGGNFTVTLPVTGVPQGRMFVIKNIGASGTVSVSSADGGTVNLATPNESVTVQLFIDAMSTYTYYIISDK